MYKNPRRFMVVRDFCILLLSHPIVYPILKQVKPMLTTAIKSIILMAVPAKKSSVVKYISTEDFLILFFESLEFPKDL